MSEIYIERLKNPCSLYLRTNGYDCDYAKVMKWVIIKSLEIAKSPPPPICSDDDINEYREARHFLLHCKSGFFEVCELLNMCPENVRELIRAELKFNSDWGYWKNQIEELVCKAL